MFYVWLKHSIFFSPIWSWPPFWTNQCIPTFLIFYFSNDLWYQSRGRSRSIDQPKPAPMHQSPPMYLHINTLNWIVCICCYNCLQIYHTCVDPICYQNNQTTCFIDQSSLSLNLLNVSAIVLSALGIHLQLTTMLLQLQNWCTDIAIFWSFNFLLSTSKICSIFLLSQKSVLFYF